MAEPESGFTAGQGMAAYLPTLPYRCPPPSLDPVGLEVLCTTLWSQGIVLVDLYGATTALSLREAGPFCSFCIYFRKFTKWIPSTSLCLTHPT